MLVTIAAKAGAKAGATLGMNEAQKSGAQAGAMAGAEAGQKAGAEAGAEAATKAATEVATKALKEALEKLGKLNKPVGSHSFVLLTHFTNVVILRQLALCHLMRACGDRVTIHFGSSLLKRGSQLEDDYLRLKKRISLRDRRS